MASDAAVQVLKKKVDRYESIAQEALKNGEKAKGAAALRSAGSRYLRLADNVESENMQEQYRSRGRECKQHADQILKKDFNKPENFGRKTRGEEGEDGGSGSAGMEEYRDADNSYGTDSKYFDGPPSTDLSDVGGMEKVKEQLREKVQLPLEHPEFYERQGAGIVNGVLFYGPPGTGKSWLAQCFAGELGWNFAEIHSSSVVSKYVGEAAKNINELFQEAKRLQPCVLFLDELDALASDRTQGPQKTNSERQMVNELLQQMQDVQDSEVLVIAATNKREGLDSAVTRSQRFNEKFHVGAPDRKARKQILEVQLESDGREVGWDSMDWPKLLDWSQGFSAADLKDVVDSAARKSASESTDRGELVPVGYRHVLEAMKEKEPSLGSGGSYGGG